MTRLLRTLQDPIGRSAEPLHDCCFQPVASSLRIGLPRMAFGFAVTDDDKDIPTSPLTLPGLEVRPCRFPPDTMGVHSMHITRPGRPSSRVHYRTSRGQRSRGGMKFRN